MRVSDDPTCVVISSGVVAGHVGLGAALPVLTRLGVQAFGLPTILLSGHAATPGVQRSQGYGCADVAQLGRGLADSGVLQRASAVLTGYLRDAETAKAVADMLDQTDHALRICDPVMGDDGKAYLPEAVGTVLRDRILPRADVAVPNLFELEWLTGQRLATFDDIAHAARDLGPERVFVTSCQSEDRIGVMAVTTEDARFYGAPVLSRRFNGAGDVTAALLTAGLLEGVPPNPSTGAAVAALDVMTRAAHPDEDDLPVVRTGDSWVPVWQRACREMTNHP